MTNKFGLLLVLSLINIAIYAHGIEGPSIVAPNNPLPNGGTVGQVLSTNGAGVYSWIDNGGSSAPFADNVAIIKNNADNTKLVIIDGSLITTGTTRTIKIPNGNGSFVIGPTAGPTTIAGPTAARTITVDDAAQTMARRDAGQTFTGVQVLTAPSLLGTVSIADTTTPAILLASGSTNTGNVTINGKTSGSFKITAADATAQAVTLTTAAQTVGAATLTIPNMANVNKTVAWLESPAFTTPNLGTPSGGVLTSCTGLPMTTGVTGILGSANGGTGVNNAGTLTNVSNTTITGGGTIGLGGFTLTVPATDTAAELGQANAFTQKNTFAKNITTLPLNGSANQNQFGALTTADATADNAIGISATTQKGLVIQGKASQTANDLEIQKSDGTVLAGLLCDGINTTLTSNVGNVVLNGASNKGITFNSNGTNYIQIGNFGAEFWPYNVAMSLGKNSAAWSNCYLISGLYFTSAYANAPDNGLSRTGAAAMALGNGTANDTTATLSLKNFVTLPVNGAQNKFGSATTAEATSDNLFAASATSQVAIGLQEKASQTANIFEWRSSTGTVEGYFNPAGGTCYSFNRNDGTAMLAVSNSGDINCTTCILGVSKLSTLATDVLCASNNNNGAKIWWQDTPGCVRLAADYTNATATFSNTALSVTLKASRVYSFHCFLVVSNSTTTEGAKIDFNGGTAGVTNFIAGTNDVLISNVTTTLGGTYSAATVAAQTGITIDGTIETNATPGTFIIRAAENSTAIGTMTMARGSYLRIWDTP